MTVSGIAGLVNVPALAVNVVAPGATPVARPLAGLTDACPGAVLAHVFAWLPCTSVVVQMSFEPSEYVHVARSWLLLPTNSAVTPPVVATDTPVSVTEGPLTVTVEALLVTVLSTVAVMVALPTATQVASPGLALPTLATLTNDGVPELQAVTASP
jgi:hypothetical protein